MKPNEALDICRTFVSHFRDPATLAHQHHIAEDPNSETFVIGCADSRLGHKSGLVFPQGTAKGAYSFDFPGPVISPEPDVMITGFLERRPNTKNILIVGHTLCAAKKVMLNALLKDSGSLDGFEKKLLETTPEGLSEAVKAASGAGVSTAELQESVNRVSLLQTTLNMYKHIAQSPKFEQRTKEGSLRVACAIRDIETNDLLVYVPSEHQFRSIEELHKMAGNPTLDVLESPAAKPSLALVGGQDAPKLTIKAGTATTTTVAELAITDLQAGIRTELEKLYSAAQSRSRRSSA